MELKDVILSTLAEMEDMNPVKSAKSAKIVVKKEPKIKIKEEQKTILTSNVSIQTKPKEDGEVIFLISMKERLLVLFEGFQAPNNTNIEAKIDMTLNFLEYMLANIDTRVEELKNR